MIRFLAFPFLAAYALFLRWCIYEAESYLAACARDGLTDSLSLREFRLQIAADQVRLANVHGRMRWARAKGARKPDETINQEPANVDGRLHNAKGV